MQTRRWLAALVLVCAVAWTASAALNLRIAVDAGVTEVEFDGRAYVIEASAPVLVEFSTSASGVTVEVSLLPGTAGAAVRVSAADDPDEVLFEGFIRDADAFRDLFYHDETGRGEQ